MQTGNDGGVPADAVRAGDLIDTRQILVAQRYTHAHWGFSGESDDRLLNFCGSRALTKLRSNDRYKTFRGRVHPELLGLLAEQDGSPEAAAAYAEDLNATWEMLTTTDVASQSRDEYVVVTAQYNGTLEPSPDLLASPNFVARAQQVVDLTAGNVRPVEFNAALGRLSNPEAFQQEEVRSREAAVALVQRARDAGLQMFGHRFREYGLRMAAEARPDLVQRWTTALDGPGAERLLWRAGDFYRALARAIALRDPERAASIVGRLRMSGGMASRTVYTPMKIDALVYDAFAIVADPHASAMRDEWLEEATTDEDLFQLALAAQHTGNTQWLSRVIERDANSKVQAVQARGMALLGFVDDGSELARLSHILAGRSGFLAEVAEIAFDRIRRNRWARHWFREFLVRADEVRSWAAMRLALRCIDRRFYLWSDDMIETLTSASERRRSALAGLQNDIANAITRNEKDLDRGYGDLLFGLKTAKGKVHPWASEFEL